MAKFLGLSGSYFNELIAYIYTTKTAVSLFNKIAAIKYYTVLNIYWYEPVSQRKFGFIEKLLSGRNTE